MMSPAQGLLQGNVPSWYVAHPVLEQIQGCTRGVPVVMVDSTLGYMSYRKDEEEDQLCAAILSNEIPAVKNS